MAVIPSTKRFIKATVMVGADEYTAHIADYKFSPTVPTEDVTDVNGVTTRLSGTAAWSLALTVFQDFSATGLARKAFNDEGTNVVMKVVDGPTTWTSTVTLVAPEIGGTPNTVGKSVLTMPCTKPVPTVSV